MSITESWQMKANNKVNTGLIKTLLLVSKIFTLTSFLVAMYLLKIIKKKLVYNKKYLFPLVLPDQFSPSPLSIMIWSMKVSNYSLILSLQKSSYLQIDIFLVTVSSYDKS